MKHTLLALVAALTVASCADMPAGWGEPDKVVFSSPTRIKIEWNNDMTNEQAVQAKALAHCAGPIEAIDAYRDPAHLGVLRSVTWQCIGK